MSATKTNNYSPSTATLDNVIGVVDYGLLGTLALSLTNHTSTNRPSVAAGSLAEVAGNIFKFSTENSISTTGVTSTAACYYYINLVPSSSECSAQFSTVVPTWRTDYQGYYENSTSVNRVVGETYFNGSDYVNKKIYFARGVMKLSYCNGLYYSSLAYMSSISTVTVSMDGNIKNIVNIDLGGMWQRYALISTYTIYSTSVSVVVSYQSYAAASTAEYNGSVFITGVDY